MILPELGEGVAIGAGKTNYRVAWIEDEMSVTTTDQIATPVTPERFFAETAGLMLNAAHNGAKWGVLGVPGPVSVEVDADDAVAQNLRVTNIPALNTKEGFDPIAEMTKADSAVTELLDSGFKFLTVNDGDLAAQTAAAMYGGKHNVVGDVINGSGTGGALVRRDLRFPEHELFHPDPGLWEVGHVPFSLDFPSRTMETTISGQALEAHLGKPVDKLDAYDPVFSEIAHGIAMKVIELGILGGAEVVVISGGIGIGAQDGYEDDMERVLDKFANSNNPMADRVPEVRIPSRHEADTYELHGAHGAMLSHVTRRAIDQLVLGAGQQPDPL